MKDRSQYWATSDPMKPRAWAYRRNGWEIKFSDLQDHAVTVRFDSAREAQLACQAFRKMAAWEYDRPLQIAVKESCADALEAWRLTKEARDELALERLEEITGARLRAWVRGWSVRRMILEIWIMLRLQWAQWRRGRRKR